MITIKTGSWWTPLPTDHVRIGISRGVPHAGAIGKGYRRYSALTPGPWLRAPDFTARYLDQLAHLDPQRVVDDLQRLAGDRIPVLVCWERVGSGQWCHRSMAAQFLADGLSIDVPELGFEDLAQDQHPLRPLGPEKCT